MPIQGPVAPGFCNHLYGMLYNLSDSRINLSEGDSIVSIEFYKINTVESEQMYKGNYNDGNAFNLLTKHGITSSLNKMNNKFNTKFKTTFNLLKTGSLLFIILTGLLTLFGIIIASITLFNSSWAVN